MILSKANLLSIALLKNKEGDKRLNNLHITKRGETVVCNTRTVFVVGPVLKSIREKLKYFLNRKLSEKGYSITNESIKKVLKTLPKDKKFGGLLEYVDFDNGGFTVNNGEYLNKSQSQIFKRDYINWREAFSIMGKEKYTNRIAIDLNNLTHTLQTIQKTVQNSTAVHPIYIDITDKGHLLLRTNNFLTGQNILVSCSALQKDETPWKNWNLWEMGILGKIRELKRKLSKVKH